MNMGLDEVLLHSAFEGTASLRFYGWSPPTLSLGYFQQEAVRLRDPLLAALPFVRRPSGGETLVHDHELTYTLALPSGAPWQPRGTSWLRRMHGVIAAALSEFGISAELFDDSFGQRLIGALPSMRLRERESIEDRLCFRQFTAGDLILAGAKIVGSAQRKHRGALLQHGAILLQRSAHTPHLPGLFELTGRKPQANRMAQAICREFTNNTDCELVPNEWTLAEAGKAKDIAETKYRSDAWNRKR
jgi:lipoate-protein ligase A